jgi:hypothetical protein
VKTDEHKPVDPNPVSDPSGTKPPIAVEAREAKAKTQPSNVSQDEFFLNQEVMATEFLEFSIVDSENLPATIQLPKKIRMQYEQPSEEYFIQNVSH